VEIRDSNLTPARLKVAVLRSLSISGAMLTEKNREFAVFFFLTFVLAPLVAVIIVAGFGFCVWMYQLIAGPPSV
jgi:nitrate reductase NapE